MNKNTKKSSTYYSSFWMDRNYDSYYDGRDYYGRDPIKAKSNDLVKLASYKRAISNFVNIVTGKAIPVQFSTGDQSYTDGNTVVISSKMDDNEFDPAVGLALHEGSHIKLTDFNTLQELLSGLYPQCVKNRLNEYKWGPSESDSNLKALLSATTQYLKDILNIVEDRRIDNYIYNTAPGYRGYYHSMYDKYFNDKIIDKALSSGTEYIDENWESYMFRLINITNKNRNLNALKSLRAIWGILNLPNIGRLKTTADAYEVAGQILLTIFDAVSQSEQEAGGDNGSNNNQNKNSQPTNGESPMGDDSNLDTGTDSMKGEGSGDPSGESSDNGESSESNNTDSEGGNTGSESNDTADTGETKKTPLSDKDRNKLQKAIQKQKEFIDGDITKKKMGKTDAKAVDAIADSGVEITSVGSDIDGSGNTKVRCYVVRKMTKELIESQAFDMLTTYAWKTDHYEKNVQAGISLGILLGKKLKMRDENRSLSTPRLKSGKISSRMLHEIGFGNFNIFEKIQHNMVKPITLNISVDASGSMSGSKWDKTQTAVVAIAKAASMISNINVVISYRTSFESPGNGELPIVLVAYDSRVDKFSKVQSLFKYITPGNTTPEGLCFEAILSDIVSTKDNSEKYFINFSDGEPAFSAKDLYYRGSIAVNHTASQIKKMTASGVKVLSYFITGENAWVSNNIMNNFKKMYGDSSQFVDVTQMNQLAASLNKRFQVGVS
jgi:hypothetical protein